MIEILLCFELDHCNFETSITGFYRFQNDSILLIILFNFVFGSFFFILEPGRESFRDDTVLRIFIKCEILIFIANILNILSILFKLPPEKNPHYFKSNLIFCPVWQLLSKIILLSLVA